ncbi:glycosyltransferase family 4 protein [Pseudomonas muyukensis]|uniref:Glycosyltransferase family 4 protein n=1 Tax=Pseudomonas muyukensis TaxID=2842357 RepID=A0ABX8MI28_9PSED|nr:glycosyltransferase family 4 protein [Pseudomonas muyukensis]QXH37111.1 glycosyltransferase family 4 protein [Pseudomonas muyukensis]
MKIVVASCVFPPEPVVSARTSFDVANHLHAQGHEVVVACPVPSRNVAAEEVADKIDRLKLAFPVFRLFALASRKSSFVSRFLENISFGLALFFWILRQRKVDVIYANVWPLFSTGLLVMAARLKGIKVVASVQDLYPESLAVQKRIGTDGALYRVLLKLDTWIARRIDHLVVISDGFYDAYTRTRGINPSKVSLVRNWVDAGHIQEMPRDEARAKLEQLLGLRLEDGQSLFVYGGNMGVASGLDEFMGYLDGLEPGAVFLFAGDGALVPDLKRTVQARGEQARFHFLSPWPFELTPAVFGAADVLLLPTATGQEFASVPSKLITYMLASRPILLLADERSESASELRKADAGITVGVRSAAAVAEAMQRLQQATPERLSSMGANGRRYAHEFYSTERAVTKIRAIVEGLHEA